jgi:hypothetical protein
MNVANVLRSVKYWTATNVVVAGIAVLWGIYAKEYANVLLFYVNRLSVLVVHVNALEIVWERAAISVNACVVYLSWLADI